MMKYFIILLMILSLFVQLSFGANQEDINNGLQIIDALAATNPKGTNENDLIIVIYVKNISESPITVLTQNLQDEIFLYEDRPKELHICLSASQLVAGAKVIPSFYDFFPVNLNPGEIAGI